MQDGDRLTALTRIGFAARGLLYLIIAWLVIGTGRSADLDVALRFLASGKERFLLGAIVVGFIGYGIWRLADAFFDIENHGDDTKGMVKRGGAAASGVIHLFLAFTAAKLLLDQGGSAGGSSVEQQTQTALGLPAGGAIVAMAGMVLIITGVWQMIKAAKASFLDHFEAAIANRDWVLWFGRLGYGARGIIFIITGYFLAQAGLSGSAAQAGGMQEALRWLSGPSAFAVAVGLGLFGLFSLIEARYRVFARPTY